MLVGTRQLHLKLGLSQWRPIIVVCPVSGLIAGRVTELPRRYEADRWRRQRACMANQSTWLYVLGLKAENGGHLSPFGGSPCASAWPRDHPHLLSNRLTGRDNPGISGHHPSAANPDSSHVFNCAVFRSTLSLTSGSPIPQPATETFCTQQIAQKWPGPRAPGRSWCP